MDRPSAVKTREPGGQAGDKLYRVSDELHDAGTGLQEAATSMSEASERVATAETAAGLKREVSDRAIAELRFSVAQLTEQVKILLHRTRHLT